MPATQSNNDLNLNERINALFAEASNKEVFTR